MMKIKYEIDEKKASTFGGLHAIFELLNSIGFDELFDNCFGKLKKDIGYNTSDILKLLVSTILAGGERVSDVYCFLNDPVIPTLAGTLNVPSDSTVRDHLLLIGAQPLLQRKFLFTLNDILFRLKKPKLMIIDIDGTASLAYGHQKKAQKGYNQTKSSDRCFQHILVSWNEMNSPMYLITREGKRHCSREADEIITEVLEHYANRVDRIIVRADSGFHSVRMVEALEGYDNVDYVVKVPKNDAILGKVSYMDFECYHSSSFEYGKVIYNMKKSKDRLYWIERKYNGKTQVLFEEDKYDYQIIVTNITNKQPHKIYALYNARGRQEKLIGELKQEYALGKITGQKFEITCAGTFLSAVTCTIIAIFRHVALRKEYSKFQLKKLRLYFFSVVAVIIKHARRSTIRLLSPPIGKWRYDQVLYRIYALE